MNVIGHLLEEVMQYEYLHTLQVKMLNQARKYLCYCLSGVQAQANRISYYTFCMKNIVNNLNENHASKNSYLFFSGGEAPCRAWGHLNLLTFYSKLTSSCLAQSGINTTL